MNANARYVALAVLLSTLTLVSAAIAQQSQPQKNGRTKKPAAKPPDFSPLASMRDTLLEIKAAVGVGINYQDYSRKMQSAAGEELKAEDKLSGNSQYQVTHRFSCYKLTLLHYKGALSSWDHLMFVRDPKYADLPDIEDQIFEAEARLQENWQDASDQLDQCRPEEPVKR